jgi:hypothetical protein
LAGFPLPRDQRLAKLLSKVTAMKLCDESLLKNGGYEAFNHDSLYKSNADEVLNKEKKGCSSEAMKRLTLLKN